MKSDLIDLDVVVRRETDKAWGLADPFHAGELIWIPKSMSEMGDIAQPSKAATITLSSSFAKDKGLI